MTERRTLWERDECIEEEADWCIHKWARRKEKEGREGTSTGDVPVIGVGLACCAPGTERERKGKWRGESSQSS